MKVQIKKCYMAGKLALPVIVQLNYVVVPVHAFTHACLYDEYRTTHCTCLSDKAYPKARLHGFFSKVIDDP